MSPRVFEGIVDRLFDADTFKMSGQVNLAQDLLHTNGEIFRGGYDCGEILKLVQILMIEAGEDFAGDGRIERREVADHARIGRDGAADRDLQKVIVSVSMGIVALAVGLKVRRVTKHRIVQAM